jgi:hypothetical protein
MELTTRCRPGDLAVCVSSQHSCNLGTIMHVVGPDEGQAGFSFPESYGQVWWCVAPKLMTWKFVKSKKTVRRKSGPVPDSCLQPIRPPSLEGCMESSETLLESADA